MKNSLPSLLPVLVIVGAVGLTAYSSGAASSGGRGYSGAPNSSGGTEPTCSICHNSGSFGEPELAMLLDGTTETTYRPGQTYRVTLAVAPAAGQPAGYGFQAQFLTDGESPVTAGTLAAPGAESQITALGDRIYAEHLKVNPDSLFTFDWTAPEVGTGDVKFYATGNAVNQNFGTSGDNGSSAPLVITLSEAATTSTRWQPATAGRLNIFPNPVRAMATVRLDANYSQSAKATVVAPDGRVVLQESLKLSAGRNEWPVDLQRQPAGVYRITVIGERQRFFERLVKQ